MNLHLESWLASATLDLALSERQRIYEEISAHVKDAIAHRTAQGILESVAEARAIQDLGDPQVARAAFQRTCYTLTDEIRLERLLGRSWWTLLCSWLFMSFPLWLPLTSWFNIPLTVQIPLTSQLTIQPGMSLTDGQFIAVSLVIALLFAPVYFFEPRIKRWLYKRFSSNGVIAVQAFMALLAAQMIGSAIENFISTTQALFFGGGKLVFGTWIIVLFLTYHWIAQQAPLTLKTIRRTRA